MAIEGTISSERRGADPAFLEGADNQHDDNQHFEYPPYAPGIALCTCRAFSIYPHDTPTK